MLNVYIRKIAIFIILVTTLTTVAAEITDVLAQLDKGQIEQVTNLIDENLEKLYKQHTWVGWVLTFLSIVVPVAGFIIGIRFKQHLDLAKELRQIRQDVAALRRWCRDLERQLYTLQTFVIVFAILYGIVLGIFAYLILK